MSKLKIVVLVTFLTLLFILARPIIVFAFNLSPDPVILIPEIPIKPDIKAYSNQRTLEVFGEGQFVYLEELIKRESKWDHHAQNPNSTAFGLGQFLNSTWKGTGYVKTNDPYIQMDATLIYIKQRHKTPLRALQYHTRVGWY